MQNNQRSLNLGLILAAFAPATIALVIALQMLRVAWPDLEPRQRYSFVDGLLLTLLPLFLTAAGGLWYLRRGALVSVKLLAAALIAIGGGFYAYLRLVHISVSVADWIFDQGDYLTVLLSAVIPAFYYLLWYLAALLRISSRRSLVINIVAVIALPLFIYVSLNIFRGAFAQSLGVDFPQMVSIALTTVFSFILLRLMLYLGSARLGKLSDPRLAWTLRLAFIGVLPLLGLLLNGRGPVARESQMVLGNFTSYHFWFLAAVNAIVYLLPDFKNRALQTIALALRLAGFSFVLYFCVVFILFLPLALLLIAAIGLGFLLLIPYFSAALQILRLRADFSFLRKSHSLAGAIAIFSLGLLFLPVVVVGDMYLDRLLLLRAIDYVQNPPLSVNQQPRIDAVTVLRLSEVRAGKSRRRRYDGHVPIYDGLYRSIVLDGAELSENLRLKLRQVFLGEGYRSPAPPISGQNLARVSSVVVASKPVGSLTESTLRVRITNDRARRAVALDTEIALPDQAFLTQHWLTIDGIEVPAQITTRSTAMWVYNRVTERLQDPSLIYFERANLLRWKVFPVPAAGFRLTRLHIRHAGDATVKIGSETVLLKAAQPAKQLVSASGKFALLAPAATNDLVRRKPYLHFIVDCSLNAAADYRPDAGVAARYLGLNFDKARVSYVDSSILTNSLDEKAPLGCAGKRHGFFLEMALRSLIHEQQKAAADSFPVFVVLSPVAPQAAWNDLSYLMPYYGDADAFVHTSDAKVVAYNFWGQRVAQKPRVSLPVRRVNDRYFAAAARLVPAAAAGDKNPLLDGAEFHHAYVLGESRARPRAVMSAIETGALNAAAGSIVLETEAQRLKLAELHKKMLSARNELDTGERPRMSEPGLLLLLLLIVPAWLKRRVHSRRD